MNRLDSVRYSRFVRSYEMRGERGENNTTIYTYKFWFNAINSCRLLLYCISGNTSSFHMITTISTRFILLKDEKAPYHQKTKKNSLDPNGQNGNIIRNEGFQQQQKTGWTLTLKIGWFLVLLEHLLIDFIIFCEGLILHNFRIFGPFSRHYL